MSSYGIGETRNLFWKVDKKNQEYNTYFHEERLTVL
jgi:hypothetical protein